MSDLYTAEVARQRAEISRLRALLAEAREVLSNGTVKLCDHDCLQCDMIRKIDAELSPEGKGGEDGR